MVEKSIINGGIFGVSEEIKKHVDDRCQSRPHVDGRYHVTSLLGCLRKYFFGIVDPQVEPLDKKYIFFRGHVWDDAFSPLYARNQVKMDWKLKGNLVITGAADAIGDDNVLIDFKTVKNVFYIEKSGAKDNNIKQVMAYIYMLSTGAEVKSWNHFDEPESTGKDLLEGQMVVDDTQARLFYFDMTGAVSCLVKFSKEELQHNMRELEEKAFALDKALKDMIIPDTYDKDTKPRYWLCEGWGKGDEKERNRCPWYDVCYDDYPLEVDYKGKVHYMRLGDVKEDADKPEGL